MDRRQETEHGSKYMQDLEREKTLGKVVDDWITDEEGNKYRMPYKIIKMVVFSNISKKDMIDTQHAARLQYRLSLLESVVKATVNYAKSKIVIIYNPTGAINRREQISQQGLIDYLASEGVHVDASQIEERDYDYLKEFYSYAYFSPSIREHPPYGYTNDEWKHMRDEYYKKSKEWDAQKLDKFHKWQEEYMESLKSQERGDTKVGKRSVVDKILGRNNSPKGKKDEKGFWFHGV